MTATHSKPTGVSVLTVLTIIGGMVELLAAAFFVVVASISLSWLGLLAGLGTGGIMFSLFSLGLLVWGLVSLFLSYGLWNGRHWAWTWTMIFAIIGLVASIVTIVAGIGIIGIAFNAIIVYYLTRARVKTFFEETVLPVAPTIPTDKWPSPSVGQSFCPHCGRRLGGNDVYCPSCGSSLGQST
jgi:hypothetical protein